MMTHKTAFVFPGQGSQTVGMGKDLYDTFAEARAVFEEIDEALNQSLSRLIFEGDAAELTQTENAQPAIMAVGIAALRAFEKTHGVSLAQTASFAAGHSLGEYTALCATGALGLADTARLLRLRGNAMKKAAQKHPGKMAAILGLTTEQVSEITHQATKKTGQSVTVANDNCPGQLVISGETPAVEEALRLATEMKARRAVELPVSGAFHSPLMQSAAEEMSEILKETPLHRPSLPVISNVTAEPQNDPETIKTLLVRQITAPVLWTKSIQLLASNGISCFVECGNGKVLTGLIKRISPEAQTVSLGAAQSIYDGF